MFRQKNADEHVKSVCTKKRTDLKKLVLFFVLTLK